MNKQRIGMILAVLGWATAVILLPPGWLQQLLAFGLLWLVPVPFVVSLLQRQLKPQPQRSWPVPTEEGEDWLIGAGLVLLMQPLFALLIHYLPGSIPAWLLLLAAILLPLLLPSAPLLPRPSAPPFRFWLPILLALLLRLPNMGYKEIQGDEGIILTRAAAALMGDEAELFLHQKGPMEILLPLVTWGVTGATHEFWARLPFLWAGLLGVTAIMLLARRWFNGWPPGQVRGGRAEKSRGASNIALIAGFLLAIMGFGVAFSRIIQYQTLVMLWGMLALLTAARFGQAGRGCDLWLTAVFLAAGLLAHYDAVLVLPAIGWALLKQGGRGWAARLKVISRWRDWIVASLLGLGVLALFYVPFMLNPNFGRTVRYLLNDRVGTADGVTSWSGTAVWRMITFYNSTYYILGLAGLLLLGTWLLWQKRSGGTAVLFFLVPALFYTLVVTDPRTHVYTIFPGAIILAAVGAAQLIRYMSSFHNYKGRPTPTLALPLTGGGKQTPSPLKEGVGVKVKTNPRIVTFFLAIGGLLWFMASTYYVYLIFVDVTPERQRTWLENQPSFYPTTWIEPPLYGLFGFPHQAGWREAAELLGDDFGTYASNEEKEITNWYMKQAPRTHCPNFDTFIWVVNAQDEVPYDPAWLQNLQVEVEVNGTVAMRVYGPETVAEIKGVEIRGNGRSPYYTPEQISPTSNADIHPVDITFGNQVRLLGYDLDSSQAHPGGHIWLTLYWRPLVPLTRNYQVFAHLYDGQMWGQHDGAPDCHMNPTTRWEPGQIIADAHRVPIDAATPATSIPLLVGMYDLLDQQRLSVPHTPDNALHLTDILVGE